MKHTNALKHIFAIALAGGALQAAAQTIERVKAGDANLDCAGILQESKAQDPVIAAGKASTSVRSDQTASAPLLKAVVGLFNAGGSGPSAEDKAQSEAAAQQKATEAKARKEFLGRLAAAKECRPDEPGYAGKSLSAEQFRQLASTEASPSVAGKITPMSVDSVKTALGQAPTPVPGTGSLFEGKLDLKGKRFYVAEFRVLFEVGGKASSNTRGGYLPGRDYGSTRAKVNYTVPNIDVAAFQLITDKAWEDFKSRLAAAGIQLEDASAFQQANGAIYEATEEASKPGAPVFVEQNLGHVERKYLVMAPTGMKLHSRGFAGLGAGNIGKRMEWMKSNLEALSLSVAVNIASLETSGSGSSIFKRESSAAAGEGMSISMAPSSSLVQSHTHTNFLNLKGALPLEGGFARFREVGGYASDKDAVAIATGLLSNLAGLGANKTSRVDLEVDLDGPATGQLALRGLATVNQAVADQIKAGL